MELNLKNPENRLAKKNTIERSNRTWIKPKKKRETQRDFTLHISFEKKKWVIVFNVPA